MCLFINHQETANLRASGRQFVYAWKVVSIGMQSICSPTYDYHWYYGFNYPIGNVEESKTENRIHGGVFHVFLEKPSDFHKCWLRGRLIRVRCYIKDLIAVGHIDNDENPCDSAAFSRVYLEKKIYHKVLNGDCEKYEYTYG